MHAPSDCYLKILRMDRTNFFQGPLLDLRGANTAELSGATSEIAEILDFEMLAPPGSSGSLLDLRRANTAELSGATSEISEILDFKMRNKMLGSSGGSRVANRAVVSNTTSGASEIVDLEM